MTSIATEATKTATPEQSLRGYVERTGNGKRKANGIVIDPAVIVELEGFNTRTAGMGEAYYSMPHVLEHLNGLAEAYLEDPMSVTPVVLQILDGKPVLRQGACRIRAIAIANRQLEAEGLPRISEIRTEEFRGSPAKAELFTLTGNSSLSLSVVAQALSIKRLVEDKEEPYSYADLSKKRGKSEQHLRQMVRVLDLPEALQTMLVADEVSMYVALEEYLYSGEAALENIRKAIDVYGKATASTLKHVKAVRLSTTGTKSAPGLTHGNDAETQTQTDDGATPPAHNPEEENTSVNAANDGTENESGQDTEGQPAEGQTPPVNKSPTPPIEPKSPSLSSVLNKKTVTTIADTAIPLFGRIAEAASHKPGEFIGEDTYTLVLTHDEMTAIINAHSDLETFLRKHKDKQDQGKA
ncbi:DNA-binding protein [Lelliottia amnigena]|uniref:DNA-binding protein n=1 Tax=Lelliottia TaxID=1330545 RepID=UPI00192CD125|nr:MULTISPECIES: DNA-binding protein [Lelliottia]MBL5885612.1 DNA-binding protein [Lelliottia aquatilis]MBL5923184.1 DNA-binding protein [Lelliottia amnigena]MBL5932100.1 DNA-binding protein [Lelliottia amnigena]